MTLSHGDLVVLTRLWTAEGQQASAVEGRASLSIERVVSLLGKTAKVPEEDAVRIVIGGINFGYLAVESIELDADGAHTRLGLAPSAELFRRDNP